MLQQSQNKSFYSQYIISQNQRMDEINKPITDKFKRELRAQDFVLIAQENKQYRNLFKIMTEKQAVLTQQVEELQRKTQRLQNEKEEYKLRNNQYAIKLNQYENIKEQLVRQYKTLKKQIEQKVNKKAIQEKQFDSIILKMESLLQKNVSLQQQIKRKDMIIEELQERLRIVQKEVMQKKIKLFTHMIQYDHIPPQSKVSCKKIKQRKKENSLIENSKTQTQTNSKVMGKSQINSISFSLISEQIQKSGVSKKSNIAHNKSIYI